MTVACSRSASSVSDAIPNLAGQKAAYIETQLKALKDGSRKNPIMGAIVAQLGVDTRRAIGATRPRVDLGEEADEFSIDHRSR